MEKEMLKTSWRQRLIIIAIAAILLGSSIAVYVAIIINGGSSNGTAKLDSVLAEYSAKQSEIAKLLSGTYLDKMVSYKSEIKAFNAEAANASTTTQVRDIVVGEGSEISVEDTNYYAYYIGYCSDEKVFESSFDNIETPTALAAPLDVANMYLIEGWTDGMVGAKVGGVRELTIPSQLAYKDEDRACGPNAPLRFIVMTFEPSGEAVEKYKELDEIYERYIEAYYEYYYSQQQASTSATSSSTSEESTEASE